MATNKHAIIRYQALDRCFSNFGRKFFIEDLIEACAEAIYSFSGIENGIKRRQIFDDIKFMESEAGYAIPLGKYQDGHRVYYRYENKEFSINKQPISTFELEQLQGTMLMLSRFKGLTQYGWLEESLLEFEKKFKLTHQEGEDIIFFEQNPYLNGLEHLSALLSKIELHQPLSIEYNKAFEEVMNYHIHPYALKQHASRWYLIGLSTKDKEEGELRFLALDRIVNFEPISIEFISSSTNSKEYFDDVIGVSIIDGEEPERIKLKVDKKSYNFIKSKPLHGSQKEVEVKDDFVIIELNVAYNYEFEMALLEFANKVEILEPKRVRKRILKRAKEIISTNSKK